MYDMDIMCIDFFAQDIHGLILKVDFAHTTPVELVVPGVDLEDLADTVGC